MFSSTKSRNPWPGTAPGSLLFACAPPKRPNCMPVSRPHPRSARKPVPSPGPFLRTRREIQPADFHDAAVSAVRRSPVRVILRGTHDEGPPDATTAGAASSPRRSPDGPAPPLRRASRTVRCDWWSRSHPAAPTTRSAASSPARSPSDWGSSSWSTTGPAATARSVPRSWRARSPTGARCSSWARATPSIPACRRASRTIPSAISRR